MLFNWQGFPGLPSSLNWYDCLAILLKALWFWDLLNQCHGFNSQKTSNAATRLRMKNFTKQRVVYVLLASESHCMKKEGVTFDECLLLHSCCVFAGLCTGIRATTVRCQPSICLCDCERRIENCVVFWAIVMCLDIAGKSCVVWYVCACL